MPHSSLCFADQDSVGTKSAPVGETPSTPRKGSNGLQSPTKSVERSQSTEEQKTAKIKPPALNNITAEATSAMSPPPAKKLALSAKKVIFTHSSGGTTSCLTESSWSLVSCYLTPYCYPKCNYFIKESRLVEPPFSSFSAVCNVLLLWCACLISHVSTCLEVVFFSFSLSFFSNHF